MKSLLNMLVIVLFTLIATVHCARIDEKKEMKKPTETELIKHKKQITGTIGVEEEQDIPETDKSDALPQASLPLPE